MIAFTRRSLSFLIIIGLFSVSALFLSMASRLVGPQATIDAAYYHIMADQLEKGAGFTEPFVWHFLNDYQSVEHPMNYWMPMGIVFYYLARLCFGIAGEVGLNIVLWSVLSVLVFFEVKKRTQSIYNSAFSYCMMLFCGRYLFYLLTTDNIAFYALFGFFFFKQLGNERSSWYVTPVIAGLTALMRIEGIVIAVFGGLCEFYKTRSPKVLAGYVLILLLVLSPWMIRNYQVLGHPWPSNSKAIFLSNYYDMFCRNLAITPSTYLSLGWNAIYAQKLSGLWFSVLNLIAAPGLFIMYPLWLAGLFSLWREGGNFFALLLGFFVVFCGVAIPLQSELGTALHVSAFFFPFFTILSGVGFCRLQRHYRMRSARYIVLASVIILWAMFATFYSTCALIKEYDEAYEPYESLLAKVPFGERKIVSAVPVKVYLETGAQGVISSSRTADEPIALADAFSCDAIITDRRAYGYQPLPKADGWKEVASNTVLSIFIRTGTGSIVIHQSSEK
ncbi:MAG: hypothetical protein KKB51_22055 [Candidatus Riflebacteria bacterium]|nr:hypothetical protein [Candidatus Riflebacteria bacterium]